MHGWYHPSRHFGLGEVFLAHGSFHLPRETRLMAVAVTSS
jgi:hypothetical protein